MGKIEAISVDSVTYDVGGSVDLSGYATKSELSSYATTSSLSSYAKTSALNDYLKISALLDKVYPVGSIYMSVNSTSPATLFGGTWEQLPGRFLLGSGSVEANSTTYWGKFDAGSWTPPVGEKAGTPYHTLTINEMPNHRHQLGVDSTSGGYTPNNATPNAVMIGNSGTTGNGIFSDRAVSSYKDSGGIGYTGGGIVLYCPTLSRGLYVEKNCIMVLEVCYE